MLDVGLRLSSTNVDAGCGCHPTGLFMMTHSPSVPCDSVWLTPVCMLDVSGFCGRSEEARQQGTAVDRRIKAAIAAEPLGNRRGTRPRGVDVDAESLARGSSDLRQRAAP